MSIPQACPFRWVDQTVTIPLDQMVHNVVIVRRKFVSKNDLPIRIQNVSDGVLQESNSLLVDSCSTNFDLKASHRSPSWLPAMAMVNTSFCNTAVSALGHGKSLGHSQYLEHRVWGQSPYSWWATISWQRRRYQNKTKHFAYPEIHAISSDNRQMATS